MLHLAHPISATLELSVEKQVVDREMDSDALVVDWYTERQVAHIHVVEQL